MGSRATTSGSIGAAPGTQLWPTTRFGRIMDFLVAPGYGEIPWDLRHDGVIIFKRLLNEMSIQNHFSDPAILAEAEADFNRWIAAVRHFHGLDRLP